ncbi:MAG TPA: activator of Hsp90 ATPase 1 family protein [Micromonosporaceae bacterium]|nr:activator of Hsp90 ATPase 1 family protein [Micromonosporaceae bacterium]HCU49231.1 activator of Hsp90 ATPase 1 family protein [Micromonosporaceae bacterium]
MIGQTKDAGWEIGVSKTLPYSVTEVWDFISSPAGVKLWLGEGANLKPQKGSHYKTSAGTEGKVRSFHKHDRMRLTWRPKGWDHDTTVQVAISPSGAKTVLRFHQEWLADSAERERQRDHWRSVMSAVADALANGR